MGRRGAAICIKPWRGTNNNPSCQGPGNNDPIFEEAHGHYASRRKGGQVTISRETRGRCQWSAALDCRRLGLSDAGRHRRCRGGLRIEPSADSSHLPRQLVVLSRVRLAAGSLESSQRGVIITPAAAGDTGGTFSPPSARVRAPKFRTPVSQPAVPCRARERTARRQPIRLPPRPSPQTKLGVLPPRSTHSSSGQQRTAADN